MFNPWDRKIPWRRKWQPSPVFLPEKSHGQRSLAGYSPWGHKESDMTEHTHKKRVHIYSGILVIKRNEFESIEVWWMNLEPAVQGEESQKEKNKYHILMHIYGV